MTVLFAHQCHDLTTAATNNPPLEVYPQMELHGVTPTLDTAIYHSGAASMRLYLQEEQESGWWTYGGVGWGPTSRVDGSSVFMRWWMKFPATFEMNGSNQDKMKIGRWGFGYTSITWYLGLYQGSGIWISHLDLTGVHYDQAMAGGGDGAHCAYDWDLAAVHNWQEYIIEVKHPTGQSNNDGWIKFHVYDAAGNGGVVSTVTGVNLGTGSTTYYDMWGGICASVHDQRGGSNSYVNISDLMVATSLAEVHGGGTPPPVYDGSMTLAVT